MEIAILLSGAVVGGLWFGLAGWLRQHRGINETISSLLLSYRAGGFPSARRRTVARSGSLDKPSTHKITEAVMLPDIAGINVHAGLLISVAVAVLSFVVLRFTIWGFALRVVGGASRVAKMVGLAVNRWVIGAAFAGGGMAGLAGAIEVIGVQGGQISMSFIPPTTSLSAIQGNKLHPLAVTSLTRAPFLSNVQIMDELGYKGFDISAWFGMFVPIGTPVAIIERLNRETVRIMADPDIREKFKAVGTVPLSSSAADFADLMKKEADDWEKTMKNVGLAQIE